MFEHSNYLDPIITTAIYWCLLMQLAIASHQYHKPRKASTKLYIGPIYFVLLILLLHEWEWNIVDKAQLPTNNCYAAFELSKYSPKMMHWFNVVSKESVSMLKFKKIDYQTNNKYNNTVCIWNTFSHAITLSWKTPPMLFLSINWIIMPLVLKAWFKLLWASMLWMLEVESISSAPVVHVDRW